LLFQSGQAIIVFRIGQRDTSQFGRGRNVRLPLKDGQNAIKKRDGRNACGIVVS
jgi:hypothetical protein